MRTVTMVRQTERRVCRLHPQVGGHALPCGDAGCGEARGGKQIKGFLALSALVLPNFTAIEIPSFTEVLVYVSIIHNAKNSVKC